MLVQHVQQILAIMLPLRERIDKHRVASTTGGSAGECIRKRLWFRGWRGPAYEPSLGFAWSRRLGLRPGTELIGWSQFHVFRDVV